MSLPPQILRIKRKRADDPVDSLYIEEGGHKSKTKRLVTEQDFVFRRLHTNGYNGILFSNTPGSSSSIPVKSNGVPIVMPTLPGQDRTSSSPNNLNAQNGAPKDQAVGGTDVPGPKRFHLSKLSATVAANQSASIGGRKRRRDQGANIAVFEERQPLKVVGKSSNTSQPTPSVFERDNKGGAVQVMRQSPRKRPGATAAISKSASSNSLRRMEQDDAKAVETRLALQKYALEELGPGTEHEKLRVDDRLETNLRDPDAMETDGSDNEYIYDTYVRQAYAASDSSTNDPGSVAAASKFQKAQALAAAGDCPLSATTLSGTTETFGYIVLPPQPSSATGGADGGAVDGTAAEFWGTFGELVDDGSSEEADWDTEQDDENAENFYGADYPEDELDSEDERGDQAIGYSRFRGPGRGVSDDEDEYKDLGAAAEYTAAAAASTAAADDDDDDDAAPAGDYDTFDVYNSWNMKHRGRVWQLGGKSSHHNDDFDHDDGIYSRGAEEEEEDDADDERDGSDV